MRKRDDSKRDIILQFINEYYNKKGEIPTVRDIVSGTGIALATAHRYLTAMQQSGEIKYDGRRSLSTERIELEAEHISAPVLGYVACGEGEEEVEEIIEYIRLPKSLVGKGEFFVLIAKGESMIDAGVHPGDYVVIRKQNTARVGDYVVALDRGVNNFKELEMVNGRYVLRSCNSDKRAYPDIPVDDLRIQGVAVSVMHSF